MLSEEDMVNIVQHYFHLHFEDNMFKNNGPLDVIVDLNRAYFIDKAGIETTKETKEKVMHFKAIQFSRERLNKDQRQLIEEEKPGKPTVIKHLQMIGFKYCKRDKHDDFEILDYNYAFISKIYAHFE